MSAFYNDDFAALDEMARRFREGRDRTSSGLWKLTAFYQTFGDVQLSKPGNLYTYNELLTKAYLWQSTRTNSIAAKIIYASLLDSHSWWLRGTRFCNEIPKEQMMIYSNSLKERHSYLNKIKDQSDVDPHWFALMVRVAKEEGWPDDMFHKLIGEALDKEPYYYQTYFNAVERSLPRWGGSPEKVAAIIALVTEHTQDLDGSSFIARGYWTVAGFGKDERKSSGGDWKRTAAAFRELLGRYPDQWNINAYAKFACLAQDREEFLYAYSRIKPELTHEAWDDGGQAIKCAVWATQPERNIEVE